MGDNFIIIYYLLIIFLMIVFCGFDFELFFGKFVNSFVDIGYYLYMGGDI